MIKSGIDQDALIDMFAEASAKQGAQVRKAVSEATLKALQARELTVENMRKVVKAVAQAATLGAQKNPAAAVDLEGLLRKAIDGMDAALLKAVQAQRTALQQFVEQGAGLGEERLKSAVAGIEKMEDMFFGALGKAAVAGPLQGPWEQALKAMKLQGSATGAQAAQTVEQLMAQAQDAMRRSRSRSMRASKVMLDGYSALVSGVLIGMSEGLGDKAAAAAKPAKPAAAKAPAKAAPKARKTAG